MTLASKITPLMSRLGNEARAGIKLFFSQRDDTLSDKVPISRSWPAVKTGYGHITRKGVHSALSWNTELFYL